MLYEKYIKLGFKRTDTHDDVEFKQTGYHGFILSKDLNENISIQVCHPELDKPKMYIKKPNTCTCHIIALASDMVFDMFAGETESILKDKKSNNLVNTWPICKTPIDEICKHVKGESGDLIKKYPVAVFASTRLEAVKLAFEYGLNPEDKNECVIFTKPTETCVVFNSVLVGDLSKMNKELLDIVMKVITTEK